MYFILISVLDFQSFVPVLRPVYKVEGIIDWLLSVTLNISYFPMTIYGQSLEKKLTTMQ